MGSTRTSLEGQLSLASVPLFTPIAVPVIKSFSHSALVKWKSERQTYEDLVRQHCKSSGISEGSMMTPVKESCDRDLLEATCTLRWKIPLDDLTEERLLTEISLILHSVLNDELPPIKDIFRKQLHMDLKEADVKERIVKYFGAFNKIIRENGLKSLFDRKEASKFKVKCLVRSLRPQALKDAVKTQLEIMHQDAANDELKLYDVIVAEAIKNESFHKNMKRKNDDRYKGCNDSASSDSNDDSNGRNRLYTRRTKTRTSKIRRFDQQKGNNKPKTPIKCFGCGLNHHLRDCQMTSEEDKKKIIQQRRDEKVKKRIRRHKQKPNAVDNTPNTVVLNGVLQLPYCADSGADSEVISMSNAMKLLALAPNLQMDRLQVPVETMVVGGLTHSSTHSITVNIVINTAAGPVRVHKPITCLVIESEEDEFLLGNSLLKHLGIDVNYMLEQLAGPSRIGDMDDDIEPNTTVMLDHVGPDMNMLISKMVDTAINNGFPRERREELEKIVIGHDCWRVDIKNDPPARVKPMQIQLKHEAQPYRCKPRKYNVDEQEFLQAFNKQLVDYGWVRENKNSRWASAALLVPKCATVKERFTSGMDGRMQDSGGDDAHDALMSKYRQTVDYRVVNGMTQPIAGRMPHTNTIFDSLLGKKYFAKFDFLQEFWQLPLHPDSQEILSFMTHDKVYTPNRVMQGSVDAAIYFQSCVESALAPLLHSHLLVWIDDLLLHSKSVDEYLINLQTLLKLLDDYNFKVNPLKTTLFATKIKWCGRVISGDGIEHCPERIKSLQQIPVPTNAAELMQFTCSLNWMRDSLINFASVVKPLQDKLTQALSTAHCRKKRSASSIKLVFTPQEIDSFNIAKQLLSQSIPLAHPDDSNDICVFTDASMVGWAVLVTQVPNWNATTPIHLQRHSVIATLSGTFTGAQCNWSTIEQEAYPIIKACEKLDHLLYTPKGFHLYCDHRNLIYIFAPHSDIKQHVKGKLLRWAIKLLPFKYVIEHIEGTNNTWADMLSRWGQPTRQVKLRRTLSTPAQRVAFQTKLRPLDKDFVWPDVGSIASSQTSHAATKPLNAMKGKDDLWFLDGKIWIPHEDNDLINRIMVIAHCGPRGHRGMTSMTIDIKRTFAIPKLQEFVQEFIHACPLCPHIKGGGIIHRPWSELLTNEEAREALHWDYLHLGQSFGEHQYVLVLKHGHSHQCELIACAQPCAYTSADAILLWCSRYGAPKYWVSDSASHFKNQVLKILAEKMKCEQRFTVAYCPWINGSIERLNRDIIALLKAMVIEYKVSVHDWPYLLPMVQHNINHTMVASLDGLAPIEVQTGAKCDSAFDTILHPNGQQVIVGDCGNLVQQLNALRDSLCQMHKRVEDRKLKQKLINMRQQRVATIVNFTCGDFVLWSRADQKLRGHKLLVRWVGPYMVVAMAPNYSTIQHLITKSRHDVHPSRLKFYCDSHLNEIEELCEHVANQGMTLDVERIIKDRINPVTSAVELLIKWKGLEEPENSWEPLATMLEDIPSMVHDYAKRHGSKKLCTLLQLT